tara:strand:- start:301 stop:684 length:384 start_codon:yes stop_codon:yes gene_type:complete
MKIDFFSYPFCKKKCSYLLAWTFFFGFNISILLFFMYNPVNIEIDYVTFIIFMCFVFFISFIISRCICINSNIYDDNPYLNNKEKYNNNNTIKYDTFDTNNILNTENMYNNDNTVKDENIPYLNLNA